MTRQDEGRYRELCNYLIDHKSKPDWDDYVDLQGWYESLSEADRKIWDANSINAES